MQIPRVQGAEATALEKKDEEYRELEISRLRRLVGGDGGRLSRKK